MVHNLEEIGIQELISKTNDAYNEGYRFVTATCANKTEEEFEITYTFDKDYEIKNLRITATKEEEIPSISNVYFCAFLVENEMNELFGLNVTNIAINYDGHLLLTGDNLDSPLAKQQIIIEKREGKKE